MLGLGPGTVFFRWRPQGWQSLPLYKMSILFYNKHRALSRDLPAAAPWLRLNYLHRLFHPDIPTESHSKLKDVLHAAQRYRLYFPAGAEKNAIFRILTGRCELIKMYGCVLIY